MPLRLLLLLLLPKLSNGRGCSVNMMCKRQSAFAGSLPHLFEDLPPCDAVMTPPRVVIASRNHTNAQSQR
jgi:hypothetical protein